MAQDNISQKVTKILTNDKISFQQTKILKVLFSPLNLHNLFTWKHVACRCVQCPCFYMACT